MRISGCDCNKCLAALFKKKGNASPWMVSKTLKMHMRYRDRLHKTAVEHDLPEADVASRGIDLACKELSKLDIVGNELLTTSVKHAYLDIEELRNVDRGLGE